MPTSTAIYSGDLRTQSVHTQSGETYITDAPTDNQGKGEGFSPTDTYKVSICYFDGYKAEGSLTISGPNAKEKSKLASDLVWGRLKKRN